MSQERLQLHQILDRIQQAALRAGRQPNEIQLIAVSKTVETDRIKEVTDAGHLTLGENRVQELLSKVESLPSEVQWHLIGHLQSNKIRKVLPHVAAIHSVDSLKLAQDINRIAGELHLKPTVLLEVNLGGESSKIGFDPSSVQAAFAEVFELPHLQVAGLMCIPPPSESEGSNRKYFAQLRELKQTLEARHNVKLPYLSMGMSDDFEEAILEGSTHVRVGSAIFGRRG